MDTGDDTVIDIGFELIQNSVEKNSPNYLFIKRCRNEFRKMCEKEKRFALILKTVEEGYDTRAEIASQCGLPYSKVKRLLETLTRHKKLEKHQTMKKGRWLEFRYRIP